MKLAEKILKNASEKKDKPVTPEMKAALPGIEKKIQAAISKHVKVSEDKIVIDGKFVEALLKGSGWAVSGVLSSEPDNVTYFISAK